jgi:citrate synthase
MLGLDESADNDPAIARNFAALRLFAVVPSIVAADQRQRRGLGVIAPREHLGYAANLLCMTLSKVPAPQVVAAFETSLILYADRNPHATAYPSPRTASVRPDLYEVVGPAIGSLQRSKEAGTAREITNMVSAVANPDNARAWVNKALAEGRTIPGFGQHLDMAEEARVAAMRGALGVISSFRGGPDLINTYEAISEAVSDATGLHPLLDYPASLAFQLIGFDPEAFVPILAVAQLPGRTIHLAEYPDAYNLIPRAASAV